MSPELLIPTLFVSIAVIGWLITTYNKFIRYENRIEEAWSSIDVALKRRFNLIPNLVSVVKGYSSHENELLAASLDSVEGDTEGGDRLENERHITHSLSNLLALAEAYPDLKASVNFLELQKSLAEIEQDIQQARVRYNTIVARLNTLVESFPSRFIAQKFGFDKRRYFALDLATQRELPEVHFQGRGDTAAS